MIHQDDMPKKFLIGGKLYNTVFNQMAKNDTMGKIRYYEQVIELDPTGNLIDTYLHELVHGVEMFLGFDLPEIVVKQIANAVRMVIADNTIEIDILNRLIQRQFKPKEEE